VHHAHRAGHREAPAEARRARRERHLVRGRERGALPALRKPNRFQNHIQFKESWAISKLTRGNTYVLIERDQRGVPSAFYVLDPSRVKVLVAPDGAVFYELQIDNLAGLERNGWPCRRRRSFTTG
jgi:phage portal protein BeeE